MDLHEPNSRTASLGNVGGGGSEGKGPDQASQGSGKSEQTREAHNGAGDPQVTHGSCFPGRMVHSLLGIL